MSANLRRCAKFLPLLLAFGCATTPPEEDPVVQRLTELDGRLLRIERILSNQSLLEQAQRVDAVTAEVRALRGQIEQMQHAQDGGRTQQRDFNADIERRLQAVEARSAPSAAATAGPTVAIAAAGAGAEDDAAAYKKAFDLLREGKSSESAAAFTQFLTVYPQSSLLDNAHYWLGESNYVSKDYNAALRSFKTVVDKFPDSRKRADALLKIGYCQYELKNWKESRDALKRAQQAGAGTQVAKLAEQRLAKLQAEGH
jgi:tol-pal system protein YbgF